MAKSLDAYCLSKYDLQITLDCKTPVTITANLNMVCKVIVQFSAVTKKWLMSSMDAVRKPFKTKACSNTGCTRSEENTMNGLTT